MRCCCLIAVFVLPLAFRVAAADDAIPLADIRFNEHIRPILSEHCFACHGPDSAGRKGDLRLDVRDAAIESGAVAAGDSKSSELIARINSDDPELVMPPPDSRRKLTAEDKELLAGWINSGAEYQKHWSFIKPSRPAVPQPAIDKTWSTNAIDDFVQQKLAALKLTPNGPADRHVLARRAALDVTGLPPTPEMLDAFISDSSDTSWGA
jgi:mono/diheme cytochrome c family protein